MNTIQTVIERVRAEFQKAPDVPFSVDEIRRLCGEDHESVEMVLEFLVDTKFLSRQSTYVRPAVVTSLRERHVDTT